jgi:hypothetical protein
VGKSFWFLAFPVGSVRFQLLAMRVVLAGLTAHVSGQSPAQRGYEAAATAAMTQSASPQLFSVPPGSPIYV